jgi:hypothetical protein
MPPVSFVAPLLTGRHLSVPNQVLQFVDKPYAQSLFVSGFILNNMVTRTYVTAQDKSTSPQARRYAAARQFMDESLALLNNIFLSSAFERLATRVALKHFEHAKLANFAQMASVAQRYPAQARFLTPQGFHYDHVNAFNSHVRGRVRDVVSHAQKQLETLEATMAVKGEPIQPDKLIDALGAALRQSMVRAVPGRKLPAGPVSLAEQFWQENAGQLQQQVMAATKRWPEASKTHPDLVRWLLDQTEDVLLQHQALRFTPLMSGIIRAGSTLGTVLAIGVAVPTLNNLLLRPVFRLVAKTTGLNLLTPETGTPATPAASGTSQGPTALKAAYA